MTNYKNIDLSDIPKVKGKRIAKNPFYDRIMKNGFTVKEYYSPEDIKSIKKGNLIRRIDITTLDDDELAALDEYNQKYNYVG